MLLGSRRRSGPPAWLQSAEVVQTQWDSAASLETICARVDVILHLAGMNSQECAADPVAALEFNALATARLLRAATRQGVKRFVYLSTAHVYGSPLAGVITEESFPVPFHPYATSHRAGEDAVLGAQHRGEIEAVVIRLSNAYGAPAHKDANCWMLLVNDLCRQAATTRRMVLQSSGQQRRNLVSLTEACRAIDHLVRLPAQNSGRHVFNVGGGWSPTIWEAASHIQERCSVVLGFLPELTRIPPKDGETGAPLDYRNDLLRHSGFHPEERRDAEIDRLIEFCKTEFS